jgi:hypothetical protein
MCSNRVLALELSLQGVSGVRMRFHLSFFPRLAPAVLFTDKEQ